MLINELLIKEKAGKSQPLTNSLPADKVSSHSAFEELEPVS